jgi:hypothetical protein
MAVLKRRRAASCQLRRNIGSNAEECRDLAREAEEFYVKTALIELADEFKEQAEKIEHQREDAGRD